MDLKEIELIIQTDFKFCMTCRQTENPNKKTH